MNIKNILLHALKDITYYQCYVDKVKYDDSSTRKRKLFGLIMVNLYYVLHNLYLHFSDLDQFERFLNVDAIHFLLFKDLYLITSVLLTMSVYFYYQINLKVPFEFIRICEQMFYRENDLKIQRAALRIVNVLYIFIWHSCKYL